MKLAAAVLAALAACGCPDKPAATPIAQAVAPPADAQADPELEPEPPRKAQVPHMPEHMLREVRVKDDARDDLRHLRKELAWLSRVGNCLPQDKVFSIALDAYDQHLVACVQVMTRRGSSVQSDPVNYACWNVDPTTGDTTKRGDLGRDYFRCQDGACRLGFPTTRWVSHDGAREVVAGTDEVAIVRRPGGAAVRTIKVKHEGEGNMRDSFTLVGTSLIHLDQSNGSVVRILDERGAVRGDLPGIDVRVVDDGRILVIPLDGDPTLVELATMKRTTVIRGAEYLATMVRFGGTYYAVDSEARRLVTLDPATLQPARAVGLRTCPLPP